MNEDIETQLRSIAHELTIFQLSIGLKLRLAADEVAHNRLSQAFAQGPHENEAAMWAHAYRGGLAVAGYILKHKQDFAGKIVLDIGTGCGVAALAAAKARADVIATDTSPFALQMAAANAKLNKVKIRTAPADFMRDEDLAVFYPGVDIITAGDVTLRHFPPGATFADGNKAMFERAKRLQHFVNDGKTVIFASQDLHYKWVFNPETTAINDLDPTRSTGTSFVKAKRLARA